MILNGHDSCIVVILKYCIIMIARPPGRTQPDIPSPEHHREKQDQGHYRVSMVTATEVSVGSVRRALPAIGRHCTSAAVLIGCHAQRNGSIESNGEI